MKCCFLFVIQISGILRILFNIVYTGQISLQLLNIPYETYAHQAVELPDWVLEKGNAYLLYGVMDNALNGDGCLFEEICNASCDTPEKQQAVLEEMTAYFLPEGVTLSQALAGEVH